MTPPLNHALAHTVPQEEAPPLRAGVFVDLAGVVLEATPTPGPLPGLRGGVGAALRLLDRQDYRIIGLAPRTHDRRQAPPGLSARTADLLARERVALAGCYCCAAGSAPGNDCPPAPGLLLRAAREHGLALRASWLLGRDAHYLGAGQRAGCRTLIIGMNGEGTGPVPRPFCAMTDGSAAYRTRDIVDAALAIIRLAGER